MQGVAGSFFEVGNLRVIVDEGGKPRLYVGGREKIIVGEGREHYYTMVEFEGAPHREYVDIDANSRGEPVVTLSTPARAPSGVLGTMETSIVLHGWQSRKGGFTAFDPVFTSKRRALLHQIAGWALLLAILAGWALLMRSVKSV